jgi:starch synthase (maltosyl-transferring)
MGRGDSAGIVSETIPAQRPVKAMRSKAAESGDLFAPKIYYFHPLLAGPRSSWGDHFRRCRDNGFDYVLTAPLFAPGETGDIFLTGSHETVHPALHRTQDGEKDGEAADQAFAELAGLCRQNGLGLFADIVVGRAAPDADLARTNPGWFHVSKITDERVDPRLPLDHADAAYPRFDDAGVAEHVTAWWVERLLRLTRAGVAGFRCIEPQLVPPALWRAIIGAVRQSAVDCRFLAWTPGLSWADVTQLRSVGFAAAFSSLPWWDGRASWFVEEHELLRGVGAVIACPEAPFGPRLARRFEGHGNLPAVYRHQLRCAAAVGDGILIPMGFEFAANEDMAKGNPRDMARRALAHNGGSLPHDGSNLDLSAEIREANALCSELAPANGELRLLSSPGDGVTALLRSDAADARGARDPFVIMINPDLAHGNQASISLRPLPPTAGASLSVVAAISADRDAGEALDAGEVRILRAKRNDAVKLRRIEVRAAALSAAPRIVVEAVTPSVEAGRFAAKRVIGETVTVEADVFADGHDVLVVECLWRACDTGEWQHAAMQSLGNDRWQAGFLPVRVGRHEFTIEAWIDRYGSLCRDLEVKRAAGADISVEITEARALLSKTMERTKDGASDVVTSALEWLREASGDAAADILLMPDLREVMRESEEANFRVRREPAFAVEIERPQAGFGAWYELFPRSISDAPTRHGTFADVIDRLPAIRDMGFDVLYLPPIYPIGETNRKGKNNALRAASGDVGSPYAIGGNEGGHDAVHSALGTIDDFRRLRDAAADHGVELALDFAIQCSPDHPWLKDHPEWFNWRPDGSVRFAENPPKKYEDIVNVDFYANGAIPGLWTALRDIVLFWANEGIRIFRVDNPHTKPLPFWEWMIAQARARYPDVIFLSEAFTRPKMMYRLAKAGFSQSYTYFTWRNSKKELTDYFTELATTEVKEFFRPHLFVNTPDINPYFLQTSGRPGFLIRAALAATLSGLWGLYSGFELCEAAPLPGREEYLDSEKYEIRVRHYDAPGNIVPEISKLNRIRKNDPALQSHLGLRFYPAHNDQIIFYGKPLPARGAMILVAVSLDPFHVQEATIEVPLWEWQLPDSGMVAVQDLMHDLSFVWHGKLQRIRLDPNELPFAIWRIAPRPEV